jgi:hypothetical protein
MTKYLAWRFGILRLYGVTAGNQTAINYGYY